MKFAYWMNNRIEHGTAKGSDKRHDNGRNDASIHPSSQNRKYAWLEIGVILWREIVLDPETKVLAIRLATPATNVSF